MANLPDDDEYGYDEPLCEQAGLVTSETLLHSISPEFYEFQCQVIDRLVEEAFPSPSILDRLIIELNDDYHNPFWMWLRNLFTR